MGCVLGRPGSSGSVSGSRDEVSTRIESNRHQVNNVSVTKTETTESTSAVVVASASNGEEVRNHAFKMLQVCDFLFSFTYKSQF